MVHQDLADHPEYLLVIQKDSASMSLFNSVLRNTGIHGSIILERIGKKASQLLNWLTIDAWTRPWVAREYRPMLPPSSPALIVINVLRIVRIN